jgi:hypothetical protein
MVAYINIMNITFKKITIKIYSSYVQVFVTLYYSTYIYMQVNIMNYNEAIKQLMQFNEIVNFILLCKFKNAGHKDLYLTVLIISVN